MVAQAQQPPTSVRRISLPGISSSYIVSTCSALHASCDRGHTKFFNRTVCRASVGFAGRMYIHIHRQCRRLLRGLRRNQRDAPGLRRLRLLPQMPQPCCSSRRRHRAPHVLRSAILPTTTTSSGYSIKHYTDLEDLRNIGTT